MSEPNDPHAELLAELRSVLGRVDPVPTDVTQFAQAALGWRRLDADLAELLADSALETDSTALTRSGAPGSRWLTFQAADLVIDVEIRTDGASRTLLGQLAPAPAAATVEVQASDGSVTTSAATDALGRFRLTFEADGRVRLRVLRSGPPAAPVETSWLTV
jgi:hypothetical protein